MLAYLGCFYKNGKLIQRLIASFIVDAKRVDFKLHSLAISILPLLAIPFFRLSCWKGALFGFMIPISVAWVNNGKCKAESLPERQRLGV
jgi:hypothetical protein